MILHIITGLGNGGAEGVLYRLIASSQLEHAVVSLSNDGVYGSKLREAGARVWSLNINKGNPFSWMLAGFRLFRVLRLIRPSVVQCWMYHANVFGGIIARAGGVSNVLWNIRHGEIGDEVSTTTRALIHFSAAISKFLPSKIIYCAERARYVHEALGFDGEKSTVINNGYDIREGHYKVLGALDEARAPVFGCLARNHAQKNHRNLIRAFISLAKVHPSLRLRLAGPGIGQEAFSADLRAVGAEERNRIEFLGPVKDVACFYNSLDFHVLVSISGEGFPNVVAESMLAGVPNVVTDSGDSYQIVGETGIKVSESAVDGVTAGLEDAINLFIKRPSQYVASCDAAKKRIENNFSMLKMSESYERLWSQRSF